MFKRCYDAGQFSSGSVTFSESNFKFQLNDLSAYTEFTALFDQYKFKKVIVHYIPRGNMTPTGTGTANTAGTLITAIDLDDIANLGAINSLREFATCQEVSSHTTVTRTVYPHIALAAYQGALTAFANKGNQWIDCAYAAVQHYGMRSIIPNITTAAGDITYDVRMEYFIEFKNVR